MQGPFSLHFQHILVKTRALSNLDTKSFWTVVLNKPYCLTKAAGTDQRVAVSPQSSMEHFWHSWLFRAPGK